MKVIRPPWIQCRADEAGTAEFLLSWEGREFAVMAASEAEARAWWNDLADPERRRVLGMERPADDGPSLF